MAVDPNDPSVIDQQRQRSAQQALLGGPAAASGAPLAAKPQATTWQGTPPPTPEKAATGGFVVTKTPTGVTTTGTPPGAAAGGAPTTAAPVPGTGQASTTGPQAQDGTYASSLPPISAVTGLTPQGTLDEQTAQATRADLIKKFENPDTRTAPQATTPQIGPASTAAGVTVGPAAQADPNVGRVAAPGAVVAGSVQAPTVAPASIVGTPSLQRAAPAIAVNGAAATVNQSQDDQLRSRQLAILDQLQGAAAGAGPSAAQAQLQTGIDAAIAAQRAQVAGTTGTGRVTAGLNAADRIADLTAQGANQAAQLKAQEVQAARQQLVQGLEGTRGQDIGVETTNAQNQQQTAQQTAQLGTEVNLADMTAAEAANAKEADLRLAAAQGNQNAINQIAQLQANLTLQAAQGNQTTGLEAAKATAGNILAASTATAGNATNIAQTNAGLTNSDTQLAANLTSGTQQFNAGQTNDLAKAQGLLQSTANQQNLDADLKTMGLDDAERQAVLNAAMTGNTSLLSADVQNRLADVAHDTQSSDLTKTIVGSLIGAAGAGGAALITKSDARAKTGVRYLTSDDKAKLVAKYDESGDDDPIGDLLDKLHPVAYRYKDPKDDSGARPGQRFGILAQDLEASPAGQTIVVDTPKGKAVHVPQAVGVLLAAMAKMHDRVKRVEARR